jgi:hypothetical protein
MEETGDDRSVAGSLIARQAVVKIGIRRRENRAEPGKVPAKAPRNENVYSFFSEQISSLPASF